MTRILIIEDDAHIASGIRFNLEAEGYEVLMAASGPAGLAKIQEDPGAVDLVLLDLMLPGMSGYAVCETLRETGNEVPVLILSARTLSEDRKRGFDVGADQYLMKPFDLDELLSRVRRLVSRRRAPRAASGPGMGPSRTSFGEVEVDFDGYQALVRGEPIRLTALEVKLLRYLVANEGRVVGRDELLERVWGFANPPNTRAVDNFIARLRRYFEPDPSTPRYFLSVRGAGYRFLSDPEGQPRSPGTAP